MADAISRVLENSEELHSWRRHLLSACMKRLIVMYNNSKDESKQEVERPTLLRLEELLVRTFYLHCQDVCIYVIVLLYLG